MMCQTYIHETEKSWTKTHVLNTEKFDERNGKVFVVAVFHENLCVCVCLSCSWVNLAFMLIIQVG